MVNKVLEYRESFSPPRFDGNRVAIAEMTHVKLTSGRAAMAAVGDAVDDQRTHAANPFPAVGIECDGFLTAGGEALVDDVEHFKEGHIGCHVLREVGLEPTRGAGVFLPPDLKSQVHL